MYSTIVTIYTLDPQIITFQCSGVIYYRDIPQFWVISSLELLQIKLLWILMSQSWHERMFSIHLGVEWLGSNNFLSYMCKSVCVTFHYTVFQSGFTTLPLQQCVSSGSSISLLILSWVNLLNFRYFNRYLLVSYCSFNLHFVTDQDLLYISFLVKCLFRTSLHFFKKCVCYHFIEL